MLQSSLVADASEVGGPSGISRSETVSSGDDEMCAGNHGPSTAPVNSASTTDAGSLSTLAMIILSYNKNDARLAIDNVRQGSTSSPSTCTCHLYVRIACISDVYCNNKLIKNCSLLKSIKHCQ